MGLLPVNAVAAENRKILLASGQTIPYLEKDGTTKTVGSGSYQEVVSYITTWNSSESAWYVVTENVVIPLHVTVKGAVNLILCDGVTLTTKKGIKVEDTDSLTIYAQSTDNQGKLITTGETFQAGIGGSDCEYGGKDCGTITINGGEIDATGGKNGAGIGGGWNGDGGTINIHGGLIRAKGGALASGIGAGRYGNGGTVNITGGTIALAEAGDKDGDNSCGAGIGGGQGQEDGRYGGGYGGTINISGGVIKSAIGGYSGAGIGGGVWGDGGKITITGGVIENVRGGKNGAGIGGGYKGKGGTILIDGAVIGKAIGGERAAGIGGGYLGDGGTITIQGNTSITMINGGPDYDSESSTKYTGGAGIGGGGKGDSGNITIQGNAYIGEASGRSNGAGIGGGGFGGNGNTITIGGNAVIENAFGTGAGAGIGSGGYKENKDSVVLTAGTITITGGTVTAKGSEQSTGIGSGPSNKDNPEDDTGVIRITGGTVTASGGKGAGIGGGSYRSAKVIITGGTVNAESYQGAGIGGGAYRNGGTIEITGGIIQASSNYGAGIGGGGGDSEETGGSGGKITISGTNTEVTATGGSFSAGIGGGQNRHGGTITIQGGTIIANGGTFAAGIGGGGNPDGFGSDARGHGGTITINGGTVTATGALGGAGIGGGGGIKLDGSVPGLGGSGGTIAINGGTVTATGLLSYAKYLDNTTGFYSGAGIGGGSGARGGTITITGGEIIASTPHYEGPSQDKINESAAIGGGQGGACGSIRISGGKVVATGEKVGIGCADGQPVQNGLVLSYTDETESSMTVYANVYRCGVQIEQNRLFSNGYGKEYVDVLSEEEIQDIGGKTIAPGVCAVYMDPDGTLSDPVTCLRVSDPIFLVSLTLSDQGSSNGWYMVSKKVELTVPLVIKGAVNLILCDGFELKTPKGIKLSPESSLTIWAQSNGERAGKLTAIASDTASCPIEGEGGKLTVNGGTVIAEGTTAIDCGKVSFAKMAVFVSDAAGAEPVAMSDREQACKENGYVKITACLHGTSVCQDLGTGQHLNLCKYCGYNEGETEDHTFTDHVCVCGATQPTHTITFYANDGTESQATQTVYDNEQTALNESSFTWEYHSFTGWNREPAPTAENPGEAFADGGVVTLTDDLILYGQWTPDPVDTPVITRQPVSLRFVYGEKGHTLSVEALADPKLTLVYHWYRYTKEDRSDLKEIDKVDADSYEIPFDTNAGTAYYYCTVIAVRGDGFEGEPVASETAKVEIARAVLTVKVNDQNKVYNDKTQGEADTVYEDPAKIAEVITVDGLKGSDTVTSVVLDGQGKEVGEYEITAFEAQIGPDGAATHNYEIRYLPGTLRIDAVTQFYAVLVSADGNGTALASPDSGKAGTSVRLTATPAEGWQFTEWQVISGNVTVEDHAFVIGTSDVQIKAVFRPLKYQVTFKDDDGKILKEAVAYDYGTPADQIVKPSDPTKAPTAEYTYTFAGWSPELESVTKDVVYTAEYTAEKKIRYLVTEGNGAAYQQGSDDTITIVVKRSEHDEETFSRFLGLSENDQALTRDRDYSAGSGSVVIRLSSDYLKSLDAGTHTLTVRFNDGSAAATITVVPLAEYKVTFDVNGHGTAPADQTVPEGGKATRPSDPVEEQFIFDGWYAEKECLNAFDFSKEVTEDVTVYAKWTAEIPTEESSEIESSEIESSESESEPVPDETKDARPLLWILLIAGALLLSSVALIIAVRRKKHSSVNDQTGGKI